MNIKENRIVYWIMYTVQQIIGRLMATPIIPPKKKWGFMIMECGVTDCVIGRYAGPTPPYKLYNVIIGDYSYIGTNASVANTTIGKFCSISSNFSCGLGIHPVDGISTSPIFYSSFGKRGFTLSTDNKIEEMPNVQIGNDVFIGAGVTILGSVKIGDGAVIGAGAVVTKDIPPYAIAVGVPAKVIKYRFDERTIERLLKRQWWNDDIEKLKNVEKYFWDVEAFLNEKDE